MGRRGRFGKYGEYKRMQRLGVKRTPWSFGLNVPEHTGPKRYKSLNPIIDKAREEDRDFIKALSYRAFFRYGAYEDYLHRYLDQENSVVLVARQGSTPVGFAIGAPSPGEQGPEVWELKAIAVEFPYQGKGVGRELLRSLVEEVRKKGAESLFLHTAIDNFKAQGLFHREGFQNRGLAKGYYLGKIDALIMVKDLYKPGGG